MMIYRSKSTTTQTKMKNYTPHLCNRGSVDDIRSSIKHCGTLYLAAEYQSEIEYERQHKNRSTVIKMLEVQKRKAAKMEAQL